MRFRLRFIHQSSKYSLCSHHTQSLAVAWRRCCSTPLPLGLCACFLFLPLYKARFWSIRTLLTLPVLRIPLILPPQELFFFSCLHLCLTVNLPPFFLDYSYHCTNMFLFFLSSISPSSYLPYLIVPFAVKLTEKSYLGPLWIVSIGITGLQLEMQDRGSHPRPTGNFICTLKFERYSTIIVVLQLGTLKSLEECLMLETHPQRSWFNW